MLFIEDLSKAMPNLKNIFEVGAHRGNDILEIKRAWPEANVYAFEADPFNYQICKDKCLEFDDVTVENLAVFDKTKMLTFNRFCDIESIPDKDTMIGSNMQFTGCGSLMKPGKGLKEVYKINQVSEEIQVQSITLKEYCEKNDIESIDALFMDVQGAEMNVINGCADFISTVDAIILEWSTNYTLYENETDFRIIKKYLEEHLGMQEVAREYQIEGLNGDSLFVRGINVDVQS